jgi:hypothetical protein
MTIESPSRAVSSRSRLLYLLDPSQSSISLCKLSMDHVLLGNLPRTLNMQYQMVVQL